MDRQKLLYWLVSFLFTIKNVGTGRVVTEDVTTSLGGLVKHKRRHLEQDVIYRSTDRNKDNAGW
jgi:hypothetical protein